MEDNPADVYLVQRALQERGIVFTMECFEDGEQAIEALAGKDHEVPDLILLDLNLPKTEGVEVLGIIRSMPKLVDVPIAILTSSESPADVHRTALLGATRFIKKPPMLDDFMKEVGQSVQEMLLLRAGGKLEFFQPSAAEISLLRRSLKPSPELASHH